MSRFDPAGESEGKIATKRSARVERPRRSKVLLHNDDFTSMDFVIRVLTDHFRKPPAEATQIMLEVHYKGVGIAGIYPREVAETKAAQAMDDARSQGMPLLLTLEDE